MKKKLPLIFFILISLISYTAKGTHIVGGEVTYVHLMDSMGIFNHIPYHKYQVNLIIYEDCQNGQPEAIIQDNPAWLGVYDGLGHIFELDTGDNAGCCGIQYSTSIPVPANFSNACVTKIPATCLLKKTFSKIYALPYNATGYIVAYQRCCRNNATINIVDPGNNGATYFCTIPSGMAPNNSAVFKNYPPQIICLNNPLFYDHSATDADGDSLSYEFCAASIGANDMVIKPVPLPPDVAAPVYYDSVTYFPPFNSKFPMTGYPQIQIDPRTGLITGTPNHLGRYLVTVCCHEWRDGMLVNTLKREFQFVVTSCTKKVIADIPQFSSDPNTYIVNCTNYSVHFVNTSTGGFSYHWDFGVQGEKNDTSAEFEPDYIYPDTGTYIVSLVINPGTTCPDSISRFVKVYPKFIAAFSDSGSQCPGAPIHFKDQSTATIKPITYWSWDFGDGDSSFLQNPIHQYYLGGIYNVVMISKNVKACTDTVVRQLVIDNFIPVAGHDTAIVKGEHVVFNASGGVKYAWSPPDRLSDTSIFDPLGTFPDTGTFTYFVHVESAYGCLGTDSIKIEVVDHAAFYVPTAFTPNGDGLNDIFRPVAIGYKNLNYFRIFDRWGEEIYFSSTLETGWDGTYKGKKAPIGTYFYQISYTDRFGKNGLMKGDVTLVR